MNPSSPPSPPAPPSAPSPPSVPAAPPSPRPLPATVVATFDRADAPPVPGFLRHLVLLWRLRIAMLLSGRGGAFGALAFVAAIAPAVPLAAGAWWLVTWPPVAGSALWSRLVVDLLAFVAACVWVAWPILSARVDDHSELARYATFPISPLRLLTGSLLGGILEPLALVIQAPILGAALGLLSRSPPRSWLLALALYLAFVLAVAAWSRAGLHVVLRVLRRRRSAQAIGGFFAVVLGLSLLIPPIDVSWLTAADELGAIAEPAFLLQSVVGLSRVPTGYLGEGLRELVRGDLLSALLELAGLLWFAAVGYLLAWRSLLRFRREPPGAGGRAQAAKGPGLLGRAPGRFGTLVAREALDLLRNPRARLLVFVPFILAVALRLFSARELVAYLAGPAADAWLLGGLCLYGVAVLLLTFAQNAFGYDGHGLASLLAAPVPLSEVLRAKNLVHGAAAAALATLIVLFYPLYFRTGGGWDQAFAAAAALALVPVLLAAGNLLSVLFPTRFHASLERRDRQPRAAVLGGLVASTLGAAPFALVLRASGPAGPGPGAVAILLAVAAVGWAVHRAVRPVAERLLVRRREAVLQAVTRA